jgi:diaminobutyrate-2-oxoglutarate transaminase
LNQATYDIARFSTSHSSILLLIGYPNRCPYRCPFGLGGSATARLSAAQTHSLLDDPEGGVLAAGLLTEIVQGEGGVIPAPDEWVCEIRAITRTHNVPLIFDEVQTGWGRTGRC